MTIPHLERIDHVHVNVRNRAAAVDWYQRVLGFEPIPGYESWATATGPLMLQNRSGTIHLAMFERAGVAPDSALAFNTDASGFLQWKQHLEEQGLDLHLADHTLSYSLYLADPDGNGYEVTTQQRDALLTLIESS